MQQGVVQITPEEIIHLILEEMEAGLCPSFYSNLVPSVYNVYLYVDDLERLRPLESRIRDEAVRALGEKLTELNGAGVGRLGTLLGAKKNLLGVKKKSKRFETLGDWTISIHENTDEDARDNPLAIHSMFPVNIASEERAGTLTERITKRRGDGLTTSTSTTTATERSGIVDTRRASGIVHANLAYEDDSGPHTFQMTSDLIKIGRGSTDRWVDLKLKAKKDVSREHLQIRRDASSGQFFIKDLSTLGTTVNGKRVPASIHQVNGEDIDKNVEIPLPAKAEIGLAGVVSIHFKTVK